jgi:hypothetical protein
MPLVQTRGAASAQGFGEFAQASGGAANYIEDVFSTYLYAGNNGSQTIVNGVDLATKGGLVWIKDRTQAASHYLQDTVRGANNFIITNNTNAEASLALNTVFNTDGFSQNNSFGGFNGSGDNYVSWTFRKQPKFFDVVTYTGNGSTQTISQNLGATPGCVIIKSSSTAGTNWFVWHRGTANPNQTVLRLNTTAAAVDVGSDTVVPNSTGVYLAGGDADFNDSGRTYVMYLFAHDAGGFGLTGTDNVISCGSYTGNGSTTGPVINLGYEPQWLMVKNTTTAGWSWYITDNMRGFSETQYNWLAADQSTAETVLTERIKPLATGFQPVSTASPYNGSGDTYIYIAIRRGPMKVPTSGTSVFYSQAISQADTIDSTGVPFPPDLVNTFSRNGTDRGVSYNQFQFADRLRGLGTPNNTLTGSAPSLISSDTSAENTSSSYIQLKADSQNITRGVSWNTAGYGNWIDYFWRRAPSFFDEVCYTGTGSATTVTHNLGVVPEMMIVKSRSNTYDWFVYQVNNGATYGMDFTTGAKFSSTLWNNTTPTSSVFSLGVTLGANGSGSTYVAYLFATCAGVSKVGSYTGTATTKQIDCGFTAGARFVLIKRSDSTGDWYVWDSARGIVAGNDPYLLLNSTAAEVTGTDYVDTYSAGFEISSTAPAAINASGGTFIFLAIA